MAVPKKNMGKALKITDKRYKTKGGQIRIEVWADAKTREALINSDGRDWLPNPCATRRKPQQYR